MKHDEFEDSEFQFVKRWVRVDTKGGDIHVLEYIKEKEGDRGVVVESNICGYPMHEMAQEGINYLL